MGDESECDNKRDINISKVITMVIVKTAYKFRAYPSKEQKSILNLQMLLCKELYNLLLEKSQQHFKDTGKTFTKYDMIKWTTKLKKEHPEYSEVYSQVLQNISDRLSKAYKNFFRRVKEKQKGKKLKVGFPWLSLIILLPALASAYDNLSCSSIGLRAYSLCLDSHCI